MAHHGESDPKPRIRVSSPNVSVRTAPPGIQAVLFDVDGTLVNTLPALIQGLRDTFLEFNGVNLSDDEIKALIGMPLRHQLRLFGAEAISNEELERRMSFAIARFESNKHLEREFDAAVRCLSECYQAGLKTALVTSKSAVELEHFLPRFSGAAYVHTAVSASHVARPKPDPESAELACERLGVDPSEAILIGDSIYDLRCARDAGVFSVAVAYGATPVQVLAAENPDVLLDTPEALRNWVQTNVLVQHAQKEDCPVRT